MAANDTGREDDDGRSVLAPRRAARFPRLRMRRAQHAVST